MVAFGLFLMATAMALGVLALVYRGYELLAAMAMTLLMVLGLVAVVKGLIG